MRVFEEKRETLIHTTAHLDLLSKSCTTLALPPRFAVGTMVAGSARERTICLANRVHTCPGRKCRGVLRRGTLIHRTAARVRRIATLIHRTAARVN